MKNTGITELWFKNGDQYGMRLECGVYEEYVYLVH